MTDERTNDSRDERVENLIVNYSMVFMGMFEEALSEIAEKITEAFAVGTSAMAGALAGPDSQAGAEVDEEIRGTTPQIKAQISSIFSEIREETVSQMPRDPAQFKDFISNSEFDQGLEIVDRYDFGLPKLTGKLSDNVLASYVFLIKSGNAEISRMFKELAEWQSSLPRPPWRP